MARRMRELEGLGSEVFDGAEEEAPLDSALPGLGEEELPMGEEGPTEEIGGEMPLDEQIPVDMGEGDLMGGESSLDPSQPDLSQLSDEQLMQLLEDGEGGASLMSQVGPQVDMLDGALMDEGTAPDERSMIENDLAMAARRRMAGL